MCKKIKLSKRNSCFWANLVDVSKKASWIKTKVQGGFESKTRQTYKRIKSYVLCVFLSCRWVTCTCVSRCLWAHAVWLCWIFHRYGSVMVSGITSCWSWRVEKMGRTLSTWPWSLWTMECSRCVLNKLLGEDRVCYIRLHLPTLTITQ